MEVGLMEVGLLWFRRHPQKVRRPQGTQIYEKRRPQAVRPRAVFREVRVEVMNLHSNEMQIGARVQVHVRCRRLHLHGLAGRIGHRYGVAGCATLEVWFPEGQTELFSEHDLVKAGK
jgi:hypothetical protein